VIDGGKTRMIAQVVTALTTVFGLLPTAFQDPFWAGLSWTVIWGTIVATVLTLYCIPALYYEAYLHEGDKKTIKRRGNIFQSLISFVRKKGKKYI
jgi:Cu/Ag efflux pump CusA